MASVVLATHNRREEVLRAIRSVVTQTVPVEIIVLDDASTDGTSDEIRRQFPEVSLHRLTQRRGGIANRNHGARLARAPIWISMDDDAEMPSPHTVEQTLRAFDHPRIAAVAIPYFEPTRPERVLQVAPSDTGRFVTSMFIGCAAAIRRDAFLAVGGFREALLHSAEESDVCLRLLDSGYVVALCRADAMVHHLSERRDRTGAFRLSTRNELLVTLWNVPMPDALPRAAINLQASLRGATRGRSLRAALQGARAAAHMAVSDRSDRRPISHSSYRLYRSLERQMGRARYRLQLEDIVPALPPLPT